MTTNNPLSTLQAFLPAPDSFTNSIQAGQDYRTGQLNQNILNQGLSTGELNNELLSGRIHEQEISNHGLDQEQNISNTINRLQQMEQFIGAGANEEQLSGALQGFIAESEANGGNPIDSKQALEALQNGGVQGLSDILGQAKSVFEQQGYLGSPSNDQGIQSAVNIQGVGTQVTTKDGRSVFVPLSESDQEQFKLLTNDQQERELAFLAEKKAVELESADEATKNKERGLIAQGFREKATQSNQLLQNVANAREVLEGLQTGRQAEFKAIIGKYLPGAVDATKEQVAEAVLNNLVFAPLSEFTGAISEGERAFAKSTVANLGFTPEANATLLDIMERKLKSSSQSHREFLEYRDGGGDPLDFVPETFSIIDEFKPTQNSYTSPSGVQFTVE